MKKQITLRIDEDVVTWFKSKGKGYQSAMNDALRSHIDEIENIKVSVKLASEFQESFTDKNIIPELKKKVERVISENRTVGDYYRPNPKQGKKAKK